MSWEYIMNLDSEESANLVITDLKNCELLSYYTTDYIDWKDSQLTHNIPYDIRFYTDEEKTIFIIVNSFSKNIFSAIKSILIKYNHHLTDCDTDENVTLEHIFRSVI